MDDLTSPAGLQKLWDAFPGVDVFYDDFADLQDRLEAIRPYAEAGRYAALVFAADLIESYGDQVAGLAAVPLWFVRFARSTAIKHAGGLVKRTKMGKYSTTPRKESGREKSLVQYALVKALTDRGSSQAKAAATAYAILQQSKSWAPHNATATLNAARKVKRHLADGQHTEYFPTIPDPAIAVVWEAVKSQYPDS